MNDDDPLMSRAADAIAESKRLAAVQQSLFDEMAAIYQRLLQSAATPAYFYRSRNSSSAMEGRHLRSDRFLAAEEARD